MVLLREPTALNAELVQEEEAEAKAEAEAERPPTITMFTDGSRLEDGATGYAEEWRSSESWESIKTHVGYNPEAYGAECAALALAQERATKVEQTPERVTIITDAQATIRQMGRPGKP